MWWEFGGLRSGEVEFQIDSGVFGRFLTSLQLSTANSDVSSPPPDK